MVDFPRLPNGDKPVWDGRNFRMSDRNASVITYSSNLDGWDDDLTELHEAEAGDGQHPIDIASRNNVLQTLKKFGFPSTGCLLEVGCSSGFMLRDLKREFPKAQIVGSDILTRALERLAETLPGVPLLQMDLVDCPLAEGQYDAVVAINVLEHIENDVTALQQIARVLKPGGLAIIEVPQGPGLYDYYDHYLRHFRRYDKSELVAKIKQSGLKVEKIGFIGFFIFLPFMVVKKLNRLRYGTHGEKSTNIQKMVRNQIQNTFHSRVLAWALQADQVLGNFFGFPIGIRCVTVARKPRQT